MWSKFTPLVWPKYSQSKNLMWSGVRVTGRGKSKFSEPRYTCPCYGPPTPPELNIRTFLIWPKDTTIYWLMLCRDLDCSLSCKLQLHRQHFVHCGNSKVTDGEVKVHTAHYPWHWDAHLVLPRTISFFLKYQNLSVSSSLCSPWSKGRLDGSFYQVSCWHLQTRG